MAGGDWAITWTFPKFYGMKAHKRPVPFAQDLGHALTRLIVGVQGNFASNAVRYLMSFGYHANTGPKAWTVYARNMQYGGYGPEGFKSDYGFRPSSHGGGYSLYYAINWRIGIGSPTLNVALPPRDPFNEKQGRYAGYMDLRWRNNTFDINSFMENAKTGRLFVTNSVYYGDWLNRGGYRLERTHCKVSIPNRFIEQCASYLEKHSNEFVDRIVRHFKNPA